MSQEEILQILVNLGLKKSEAKTYFYLAKRGPKKANEITKTLRMTKQQLYPIIKSLQNKAIIVATLDRPAVFSAVPFDRVLDLISKVKFEEVKIIQNNKGKLLSDWESISLPNDKGVYAKFIVIKGRKYVYSKIQQMIEETTSQFSVISNFSGLLRVEQSGVFEVIKNHPMKSKIKFRIITEVLKNHLRVMNDFLKSIDSTVRIKGRNSDLGLSLFPKIIIRDNKEILYFISQQDNESENLEDFVSIFTNCVSLVKPFSKVFEDLWENSSEIQEKILEIKKGTSPKRTRIIEKSDIALVKYNEALKKAKKDIIFVTTSDELQLYWKKTQLLKELASKGVLIRIMAPISRKNLKFALYLSDFCEVRHVPNEYLKTIIVDGKYLFEFKKEESQKKKDQGKILQTLYSNDFEYVEKAKNMLLDIWKNSVIPSALTAESMLGSQSSISEHQSQKKSKYKIVDVVYNTNQWYGETHQTGITERDVTRRILNYKKNLRPNSKIVTLCGTVGYAIIHSHPNFDFPNLLIAAYHIDEESSFGAEDALVISLGFNTSQGFRYVPMTIVGDNPKATEQWKKNFENTLAPARKNYHLFKRGELQIQIHGNTFNAGWTRAIPLLPNQPLPPSSIYLSSTGRIRTRAFDITNTNGIRHEQKFNYYDAFITFIHNNTIYRGPSTDGLLVREMFHNEYLT